jgi:hypothetical protein
MKFIWLLWSKIIIFKYVSVYHPYWIQYFGGKTWGQTEDMPLVAYVYLMQRTPKTDNIVDSHLSGVDGKLISLDNQ